MVTVDIKIDLFLSECCSTQILMLVPAYIEEHFCFWKHTAVNCLETIFIWHLMLILWALLCN